jgi:hypothetical protein
MEGQGVSIADSPQAGGRSYFGNLSGRMVGDHKPKTLRNRLDFRRPRHGAESASRYYYGTDARHTGREEAARLAAILPNPRKRRPERMNHYSSLILERMSQMGW